MLKQTERKNRPGPPAPDAAGVDEARRTALLTMSKYACYTAPAILTLLSVGDAQAGPRLSGYRGRSASYRRGPR
jgi:hypothetical protein